MSWWAESNHDLPKKFNAVSFCLTANGLKSRYTLDSKKETIPFNLSLILWLLYWLQILYHKLSNACWILLYRSILEQFYPVSNFFESKVFDFAFRDKIQSSFYLDLLSLWQFGTRIFKDFFANIHKSNFFKDNLLKPFFQLYNQLLHIFHIRCAGLYKISRATAFNVRW